MRFSNLTNWWRRTRHPEAFKLHACAAVDPWSRHSIHPAFPHTIRAGERPDGTPFVEVITNPAAYRDRSDRPWLVIAADGETVHDENPMPPQALYEHHAVKIPTDRWIARRTAGVAPAELTDEAIEYMTAGGWQGNGHGAERLAEWAAKYAGPQVVTLCSASDERVFLDEDLSVVLFEHPEHGPLAAVLYMDSGDEADTYDFQLWFSTASPAQWSRWGDFDLHCPFGHLWHYRSEQHQRPDYVTDQDGDAYEHFDLWPAGMGYPAILTPHEPGSREAAAYCPRCGSPCVPSLAELRV